MRVATSQLNMLAEVLWYEEVAMFLNTDRLPVRVITRIPTPYHLTKRLVATKVFRTLHKVVS
jgi:hypothetical protein